MPIERIIKGDYEFLIWEKCLQVHCGDDWSTVFNLQRPVTPGDIEFILRCLNVGESNHKNKVRKAMAFLND